MSRFNRTSLKETWKKKKVFPLLKCYSFDVKAIVTKKSRVTFWENMVRGKEMW